MSLLTSARATAVAEVVEGEVVEEEVAPVEELTAEVIADEVGTALALREAALVATHALPTVAEYNVLGTLANRVFQTTFVPAAYRGREPDVFAAFLFGREIGLGPMMALRDIHMIDGRPALAAHRQLAKLREGGVVIVESESTAEVARIKARRIDTGEVMTVEFTMVEAVLIVDKGGKHLVDKVNWKSYPADMLWARCVGRLTRRLGPDIAGGLPPYTAEEVADFSDWGVEYGEAGPVMTKGEPRPEPPAYRREFPDYNWPSSMAEIRDRLGMILGPDEAVAWLRQAREALFPEVDVAAYTKAQKESLFQRLSSVLAELDGPDGPSQFDVGVRVRVRAAFGKRLDGTLLEGPDWSLGPDEAETRPPKDDPAPPEADFAHAAEPPPDASETHPPDGEALSARQTHCT